MEPMKRMMTTLSFCYAPCASHQYKIYRDEHTLGDIRKLCQKIMATRQCDIILTTTNDDNQVDTPTDYILTMTGPLQSLVDARFDLLLYCPIKVELNLSVPASESLSQEECQQIAIETETTIRMTLPDPHQSCLTSDYITTLTIIGIPINTEKCRLRLLVLLDEKAGLRPEKVHIPLKYQYLIGGRKRTGLYPIIEETCTNIYFPSPWTAYQDDLSITITGEVTHVARVKDMLNKLAKQKAKSMYQKSVKMAPQKLDWMLLHCKDDIRKIMHDNGSFVEFPLLGSGLDTISVYAETRVNAERTLRALFLVSCSINEALFYFNDHDDNAIYTTIGSFFHSSQHLVSLISQLVQISGAQVTYKTDPGCIHVLGTERAIRNIYQRLQEFSFLTPYHSGALFRVESAIDHRDFISGKKNGKIIKIMKTSGAVLRFLPSSSYNDDHNNDGDDNNYNFIIEVESNNFCKALDGWTLLQQELPAEISFFVPESYHKRIIGVGGKNIQHIMKKYGVYVKFSNTEEFASLGGYHDNQDNVVARTPMKNQINLDNLRFAVMALVQPNDHNTRILHIPYRSHRLYHHHMRQILEMANTVTVLWPECELATDKVIWIGPESQMDQMETHLWTIIPRGYRLCAPLSDPLNALLDELTRRLALEYGIHLASYADTIDTVMTLGPISCMNTFSRALDFVLASFKANSIVYYEQTRPIHPVCRSTTDMPFVSNHRTRKPEQNETNLRAIFDADLTQQEKKLLKRSRDIWSYVPTSNNNTLSSGFGGFFAQDYLVQSMLEKISLADHT